MLTVCDQLTPPDVNGYQQCQVWTELKPSVFDELNALTRDQIHDIFYQVIAFWLVCWAWNRLVKFIGQN